MHASLLELVRVEARRIARGLPRDSMTLDDLVGHGHVGLVEAQRRFDPQLGVPFDLFARRRVRGAIFDALRADGFLKRRGWETARRQSLAHRLLESQGEAPSSDDAASLAATVGLLAAHLLTDAVLTDEPAPDASPDEALADAQSRTRLLSALDALATEDREVVDAVYDFDEAGDSGAELARRRGVSRSHVSRAHLRILESLRGALAEAGT